MWLPLREGWGGRRWSPLKAFTNGPNGLAMTVLRRVVIENTLQVLCEVLVKRPKLTTRSIRLVGHFMTWPGRRRPLLTAKSDTRAQPVSTAPGALHLAGPQGERKLLTQSGFKPSTRSTMPDPVPRTT